MTEQEIRDHVIDVAMSFYGIQEGSIQHKMIVDAYNSVEPRPRGYKLQYDDSWCDAWVTVVGDRAGITNLIGRECGCEEHVKIFKALGIWEEDGTIIPEKADIIVYNWDKKTQPNDGYSDHIGYVAGVNEATGIIKVIEGNHNDQVGYRTISIGTGQIRGYARPNYASMADSSFYKNLGWNEDQNGWWYTFGYKKGDYHCNNAVRIFSETRKKEELYLFDTEGYAVKDPLDIEFDEHGAVKYIHGTRIK